MTADAVVRIELDEQADTCYVSLSTSEVDRTVELTDTVLVDLDEYGVVVGIETLHDCHDPLRQARETVPRALRRDRVAEDGWSKPSVPRAAGQQS